MTDIVLPPLANMQTATLLNSNMQKVQDAINNDVVHRSGGNNTMNQDLDMNSNNLLNVATDPNDPSSLARIQDLGNYKAAAAQSATDAANSAADAANSATSAANSAASAGSNLGYGTKAQMDADLSPPDGTIRIVTNDPIIDNNQTYRKSGAAGTGSWEAAVDRLANALGNTSGFQQAGAWGGVGDARVSFNNLGIK